jgi:hypothetical protein
VNGRVITGARLVEDDEWPELYRRARMVDLFSMVAILDDGSEIVLGVLKEGTG